MPFINRELVFLLNNSEHQVNYVLEVIKDELTRNDIMSPEFRDRVDPFFRRRTSHFIHELNNFARSPYDIIGYDLVVRYRRRQPGQVLIELSTSDSDNDEPVIINDVPLSNLYVASVLSAAEAGTSSSRIDGQGHDIQEIQPPVHSNNPSQQTNNSHSNTAAATTSASSNTSAASVTAPTRSQLPIAPAEPISLDSSSDDDCQFVLARKPPHLRTPEYVSLNSDSDSDVVFVQEDRLQQTPKEVLNTSGNSAGTSSAAVGSNLAGCASTNTLPLKKRRNLSETHSTSSEDNKPLILHLNLKKNTFVKRRSQNQRQANEDSSSDEEDQDWESKIKKTKIKSNRRKEVALHKYIKGAVNQGASTSGGFGVKNIYEDSSDSGSEDIRSSENDEYEDAADDDEEEDDEDSRPLRPNDRTINIKIIKNQDSFCSVVNDGSSTSPVKRKRKTSKSGSRKSSTKKVARAKRKRKVEVNSSSSDQDEEKIDVENRFDSSESNDSF